MTADLNQTTIPRPVYKPGMSAGLRELCDHCCADIKWLEGEIKRLCAELAAAKADIAMLIQKETDAVKRASDDQDQMDDSCGR